MKVWLPAGLLLRLPPIRAMAGGAAACSPAGAIAAAGEPAAAESSVAWPAKDSSFCRRLASRRAAATSSRASLPRIGEFLVAERPLVACVRFGTPDIVSAAITAVTDRQDFVGLYRNQLWYCSYGKQHNKAKQKHSHSQHHSVKVCVLEAYFPALREQSCKLTTGSYTRLNFKRALPSSRCE